MSASTGRPGPLRIAILGFGKVARALCDLLVAGHGRAANGVPLFEIVAVASRSRGMCLADPAAGGLQPEDLLADNADASGAAWTTWPAGWDGTTFAREVSADVLLELTTLDAATGQPAIEHIEAALRSGKHVVTANKGPIAWDYARLASLAEASGRRLLFEATVMDGAPVFNLYRYCLRGCTVTGIRGILNSTTNVILTAMEAGESYAQALAGAQGLGIVEADPALDVDGWDAAVKLCALANVMMGAGMTPPAVARTGIRDVTRDAMSAAAQEGAAIRLIAEARYDDGGRVIATVAPRRVPRAGAFGQIAGTSSILTIQTDLLGALTITEQDPQLPQTAYGVLADLLEIAAESGRAVRPDRSEG